MMRVGDAAPEIDRLATSGLRFQLSRVSTPWVVVYFFPKAFSRECSEEALAFKTSFTELTLARAAIVGISTDTYETLYRFAGSFRLPFPLLADTSRDLCRAYETMWPFGSTSRRITYILDDQHKVAARIRNEKDGARHRQEVFAAIDRLKNERSERMRKMTRTLEARQEASTLRSADARR